MALLLPILTFIFIFLSILKKGRETFCLRSALLFSSLLMGLLLFFGTEILGHYYLLDLKGLSYFWGIIALVTFILLLIFNKGFKNFFSPINSLIEEKRQHLKQNPLSWEEKLFLGTILIFLILLGTIAFVAPPNNWDSMTYHMSRVAHWIQNKTLTDYTTNIARQLTISPFAEYIILHVQILTQSDRFANFLQFFAFIGCIIGVSLITKLLKGNRSAQILSSALCVSIPMGILQSTSTQNDLVSAFWGVCFIVFLFLEKENFQNRYLFPLSLSLALSFLTKSSSFAYLCPFILFFILKVIRTKKTKGVITLCILLMIPIMINTPHAIRCKTLDKSITDQTSYRIIKPGKYGLAPTISNALKNIKVHLTTPFQRVNEKIQKFFVSVHGLLHMDIDDPDLSYGQDKRMYAQRPFHEDHAGNLLHTILITFCVLASFFFFRGEKDKDSRIYLIGLLCGFLIFVTFCKWQPWISRLHLPLFIYSCSFCAIIIKRTNKAFSFIVGILLLMAAIPWIFNNESKPFFGKRSIFIRSRQSQYFANQDSLEPSFVEAADYIKSIEAKNIGLLCSSDDWEYPIWKLLNANADPSLRIEHIELGKTTPSYPLGHFTPDAIFSLNQNDETEILYQGNLYVKTRSFLDASVFVIANEQLLIENFIYQFKELINFSTQSGQYQPENVDSPQTFITFQRKYINQAKILSLPLIKKINPKLLFMIKEVLLPGLEIKLMGYVEGNQRKYLYGESLHNKWLSWANQNLPEILKGMQNSFK